MIYRIPFTSQQYHSSYQIHLTSFLLVRPEIVVLN